MGFDFFAVRFSGILITLTFFAGSLCYAQQNPPSQTTGGIIQQEQQLKKEKKLEEKIRKPRPLLQKAPTPQVSIQKPSKKIFIREIKVEGVTLVSQDIIEKIVSQYENKELSLQDMQKVTDLITDEYRKRNYLTSFAYLPRQTVKDNILVIRVIEGKVGSVKIEGNRYFKSRLLEKELGIEEGGYFDYSALQHSLVYINEHPDRLAKAMLVPGKKPGTTDIIVKVKDKLPIHIGFEYDNFGSRYIEKNRGSFVFEHNNLLGFDDKLYFRFQESEAKLLKLKQWRYSFPINPSLEVGAYFLRNRLKLGKEFKYVEARGKANIAGLFLTKTLVSKGDLDLRLNLGFDWKNIYNYLLGEESSKDEVRIFKIGSDADFFDSWGRNILSLELDTGIPRMWGGLTAKDPSSSRAGAGGRFLKLNGNYFRLQPGPFSSSFLLKSSFQFSPYSLVASEQFQIGGPSNVRGYPPAEFSGDKGAAISFEWSLPVYLIPRKMRVPFTRDATFYNSLRIVTFFDWATVQLKRVLAGEKKHRTLKGYGFGLRFNPADRFSLKVEVGFPIKGSEPSDGNSYQTWIEMKVMF